MKVNIAVCFKPENHTDQQNVFLMVVTRLFRQFDWKDELCFNLKDLKVMIAGRQDGGEFAVSSFGNLTDYFDIANYGDLTMGVRLNGRLRHLLNMRTGRKSFSIAPYELTEGKPIAMAIYLIGVMSAYGDNIADDNFQIEDIDNCRPDINLPKELGYILKNKSMIPDWMALNCN